MNQMRRKSLGSYYTPAGVVSSLVRWVLRSPMDRLLDPACGDGRFLVAHGKSVGVEHDVDAAHIVHQIAPGSLIHEGDFFAWAAKTCERFECAAGNPPFIRYQRFTGDVRQAAIRLCSAHGTSFSSLTSSWAPFIVATATLLKPGGRMAFVVPAEIGHAPYAQPVLKYLVANFRWVQVLAIRQKLFPGLSEDCWLLYCNGFGGRASQIAFSTMETFHFLDAPPKPSSLIPVQDWLQWGSRLRPYFLPADIRELYREIGQLPDTYRLSDVARVGIGYVTGANDFFHFTPSDAERSGIPGRFLHPAVRNGRCLVGRAITDSTVAAWKRRDDPVLLLRIRKTDSVPETVNRYLASEEGKGARNTYKCRNREPWYVVPDVSVPDAFLSYMSGNTPALVANRAKCVATNSIHVVKLNGKLPLSRLQERWEQPITQLSCELEGHPLGGGMLKIEPREAGRVILSPRGACTHRQQAQILEGLDILRAWRHYGQNNADLPVD